MNIRPDLLLLAALLTACGSPGDPAAGDDDAADVGDAGGAGDDHDDDDDNGPPDAAMPVECGDGVVAGDEGCDDGGTAADDGCAADCSLEPGYACPDGVCVATFVCGDGLLEAGEACDDHNLASLDGCDDACDLEDGWTCEIAGIHCAASACGDGVLAGFEACDDGSPGGGDGCSDDCALEPDWHCPVAGQPCEPTVCGDGVPEGSEECDDGDNDLGDGCDPMCHAEPVCDDGQCEARCGDGVRQVSEACDDGNLLAADGCSPACVVEAGFECVDEADAEPETLDVAIVYRDFRGADLEGGHPDFDAFLGTDHAIVTATLGEDGKPVYAGAPTTPTTTGATEFDQWYHDAPGVNLTFVETLPLTRIGDGEYVYDDDAFFPLDERGWIAEGSELPRTDGHNFGFTSELRYWFAYAGGEVLSFRGDDDVWVFINGKLAIDLGGVHSAQDGAITLDETAAAALDLTLGGTYEVVVLQAERHVTQSSYKLTLKGFNTVHSVCDDACGDGVTSPYEVCDDGVNAGGYGSCTQGCMGFGPHCGDGALQAEEACDDGVNAGGYGGCAPTCQLGPRCGDGVRQAAHEQCDAGAEPSALCTATCEVNVE